MNAVAGMVPLRGSLEVDREGQVEGEGRRERGETIGVDTTRPSWSEKEGPPAPPIRCQSADTVSGRNNEGNNDVMVEERDRETEPRSLTPPSRALLDPRIRR